MFTMDELHAYKYNSSKSVYMYLEIYLKRNKQAKSSKKCIYVFEDKHKT